MRRERKPFQETEEGIQATIIEGLSLSRAHVEVTSAHQKRFFCPACKHKDWKVKCVTCNHAFTPARSMGMDKGIGDLLVSDRETVPFLPGIKINFEVKNQRGTPSPEQYDRLEEGMLFLVREPYNAIGILEAYRRFFRAAIERCPEELAQLHEEIERWHTPPKRRKPHGIEARPAPPKKRVSNVQRKKVL